MPRRPATTIRTLAPSAPLRRPQRNGVSLGERLDAVRGVAAKPAPGPDLRPSEIGPIRRFDARSSLANGGLHPLTDASGNARLQAYDNRVKEGFDRIVPVLKRLSSLQHEADFIARAQQLARDELGYELPLPILEQAWVTQLDMRTLFAWCVFETYEQMSAEFFQDDPLSGQRDTREAKDFEQFLLACGFHLLDITPCADGRLAHAIVLP
jgi:hypothetical protein